MMQTDWLSIDLGDPAWIVMAYVAGLAARTIGLPPLVGYLGTGFLLHALGAQSGEFLEDMSALGITLLLFTIGLKLDARILARPEVWAVGALQMVLVTAAVSGLLLLLAVAGLGALVGLTAAQALLVGFALSFSSTVFAIKVLEERGARSTRHGRVAIGVLILQDIAAVAFLAVAAGETPSLWALLLFLLIPLRGVMRWLMRHSGHGELLMLFGVAAALTGAALFASVGVKGDLGALVFGMLLAGGGKADELNKALLGLKDLFLVGFFLSIGMSTLPTTGGLVVAALLVLLLPAKTAVFFLLFSWRRLRARTSWQAALDLSSYSEFGLIVTAVAVESGWIGAEWLALSAVAVAASFAVAAPFAERGDSLFTRHRRALRRLERLGRLPGDEDLHLRRVDVVVFGMGRMGSHAYDAVAEDFEDRVLGVDVDEAIVRRQADQGRRVVLGDATDPDFWSRAHSAVGQLEWVLLTMSSHEANVAAVDRLRDRGFAGRIAATSTYPDEAQQLRDLGVDFAFDVYAEAGSGFAGDLRSKIRESDPD
jgi:predicted Kef-type K+ transport protein